MIRETRMIKEEVRKSWIFILLTKPKLYLYNLIRRTFLTGIFMFIFYELLSYAGLATQSIPSNLHSLMGIVIGLLLVFRTNTAYDRWWEARKIFSSLHSTFLYIYQKSRYTKKRTEILYALKRININIFGFVSTSNKKESDSYKKSFLRHHINLSELLSEEELASSVMGSLEKKYSDMLDQFSSLERIKSTPIPLSYTLHIKLSIMFYLISLPFGLFFELGVWATPFIMILFFIIGGIEIISNEIENPFSDSPNDLPINDYKEENEKYLNV